ncbi:hypothetical protein BC940DRAFT_307888 [Gongronella butleri]|nr:hypothetical protein BC940DRAFT_307888 [Gongronella butleri]
MSSTTSPSPVQNTSKDPKKVTRKRRPWSEEETKALMLGCLKHGVGCWKKILLDSEFSFNCRSSVDLKDRFRTICPKDEYEQLYTQQDSEPYFLANTSNLAIPVRRKRRRIRRVFNDDEDRDLLKGVSMHGVAWANIAKDPTLNLSHRRGVDLRDRLRNKYPEIYQALGFRIHPKK